MSLYHAPAITSGPNSKFSDMGYGAIDFSIAFESTDIETQESQMAKDRRSTQDDSREGS
jgi:hypothetical protein